MACNKEHRYNERLLDLPEGQGGAQRHKCCGCAYDLGYEDGYNNTGRSEVAWEDIEESQAGTGRHKDAEEAYLIGYSDGARDRRTGTARHELG